jgi:H+/Cl- antiporter ClcA
MREATESHFTARKAIVWLLASLGMIVLLSILAALLGSVVMQVFGGIEQWQQWRIENYWTLLAWRLCLYTVLVLLWLRLKAHLPELAPGSARSRLIRVEVMAVLLVLLIELSKAALQWTEAL